MVTKKDSEKKVTNEKPISLHGVDFKEMMKAFLKVKPDKKKDKGGEDEGRSK
jgi:hypothetical protein